MRIDRLYNVLLAPVISEKSTLVGEQSNQYVFRVAKDASKAEIREAVERIFEVKVHDVRTLNVKGKRKRSFRGVSRKPGWKKAYVRVEDAQEIDFAPVE